jgi:putative PEP-CTERM system histidine kinase
MNASAALSYVSAGLCTALAFAIILRGRRSPANWLFLAGMILLACIGVMDARSLQAPTPHSVLHWQTLAFMTKAFLPVVWIGFSLTFARGNYSEFLSRWRLTLALALMVPVVFILGFQSNLISHIRVSDRGEILSAGFGAAGQTLNVFLLVSSVIVLMNLEKTFRAAIGTMRWRIKYVVLGMAVILGARIYTGSQAMLYSGLNLSFSTVEAAAVVLGCLLIFLGHLRAGHFETDVYPSQALLYSSITVIVVGIYLLIIGLLARLVTWLGGDAAFPVKAFLILLAVVGLAVVLLSNRLQQRMRHMVSRHFQRPLYDYRSVWRSFTEKTISRLDQEDLCRTVTAFVSQLFQVLSVNIWLVDSEKQRLVFGASTSLPHAEALNLTPSQAEAIEVIRAFELRADPVDLDGSTGEWGAVLRRCTPGEFREGGHRLCVPVRAGQELLGLITLGDRVGGVPMSTQEYDLLKCIADQAAAGLQNIQLSHKLMRTREMEAFQTMSAFFVHDLKNTASTLSLMLKNLPLHFNDPAFREDALKGIGNTVDHINSLIGRLGQLRQGLTLRPAMSDLNGLVAEVLKQVRGTKSTRIEFQPGGLQPIALDADQVRKVVLNLVLNAQEALNGSNGSIQIRTHQDDHWTVLAVQDNGCGMTPEFIQQSLFRPFQTTKKRGIGIGMFQSKMIVEAHKGRIEVHSIQGQGTTFQLFLPNRSQVDET